MKGEREEVKGESGKGGGAEAEGMLRSAKGMIRARARRVGGGFARVYWQEFDAEAQRRKGAEGTGSGERKDTNDE